MGVVECWKILTILITYITDQTTDPKISDSPEQVESEG